MRNQPTADTQSCGTCYGTGDYVMHEYGRVTHDGPCDRCGGTGRVPLIRDTAEPLPEGWMEAIR